MNPRTLLSDILCRLERPESPILRYRETEAYPAQHLKTLTTQGLLVDATPAKFVPVPASGGERSVAVHRTKGGWYGVDENGDCFTAVFLTDDDVRQYQINVGALVQMIRRVNRIEGSGEAEDEGLITVGQRHIYGLGTVVFYLSLMNNDVEIFVARCRRLQAAADIARMVVLVPRDIAIPASDRVAMDEAGVVVIPLWPAVQAGSLAVNWEAVLMPRTNHEAIVSPGKIIYNGREYACDLTKPETLFLTAHLTTEEIDVHQIMHMRKGAVIRGRYQRAKKQRNRIHQFLSRLNAKLADAQVPISYSLPRGRDTIVRDTPRESRKVR